MTKSRCFACSPVRASTGDQSPSGWSQRRALCAEHQSALILEDGQSLGSVLRRAAPPDSPLEGSSLARIYNPVFIGSTAGRKAWLDFAAGGIAALEDRFLAGSYFEFVALEQPNAVRLLYFLHTAARGGTSVVSFGTPARLLSQSSVTVAERNAVTAGFDRLVQEWHFGNRVAQLRAQAGRLWPESFEELEAWIQPSSITDGQSDAGLDTRLFEALNRVAPRRFVGSIVGSS